MNERTDGEKTCKHGLPVGLGHPSCGFCDGTASVFPEYEDQVEPQFFPEEIVRLNEKWFENE